MKSDNTIIGSYVFTDFKSGHKSNLRVPSKVWSGLRAMFKNFTAIFFVDKGRLIQFSPFRKNVISGHHPNPKHKGHKWLERCQTQLTKCWNVLGTRGTNFATLGNEYPYPNEPCWTVSWTDKTGLYLESTVEPIDSESSYFPDLKNFGRFLSIVVHRHSRPKERNDN